MPAAISATPQESRLRAELRDQETREAGGDVPFDDFTYTATNVLDGERYRVSFDEELEASFDSDTGEYFDPGDLPSHDGYDN